METGGDLRNIVLGHGEDDGDGLDLHEHHQAIGVSQVT